MNAHPIVRRIAWGLGSLVAVVLVAAAAVFALGSRAVGQTHAVPPAHLAVTADSGSVARGAHLLGVYGCRDCHGADLAGTVMEDAPPFRLVASNLTPGGVGAAYTVEDWERAIRHGVGPDGTALFVMPSGAYSKLSDTDVQDVIAALQALPPVDNELSGVEWKPLGTMLAAGPIDLASFVTQGDAPATSPPPDSTAAYGAYVTGMMCAYCHGPQLSGAVAPGSEAWAPDLRAAAGWDKAQFDAALTSGVLPDGRTMDPKVMPWTATAHMTPAEREGIRRHLQSLATADRAR